MAGQVEREREGKAKDSIEGQCKMNRLMSRMRGREGQKSSE